MDKVELSKLQPLDMYFHKPKLDDLLYQCPATGNLRPRSHGIRYTCKLELLLWTLCASFAICFPLSFAFQILSPIKFFKQQPTCPTLGEDYVGTLTLGRMKSEIASLFFIFYEYSLELLLGGTGNLRPTPPEFGIRSSFVLRVSNF